MRPDQQQSPKRNLQRQAAKKLNYHYNPKSRLNTSQVKKHSVAEGKRALKDDWKHRVLVGKIASLGYKVRQRNISVAD